MAGVALIGQSAAGQLATGTKIDRYRIESLLGQGGMGTVYRAVADDGGETVALKVMKGESAGDSELVRRFMHEARAASQIQHAHVVPLLDFGECEGRRYLVMSYIQGQSLEQRIDADGPQPVDQVVRMASQIASALDALHEAGIIHRDVKAGNILFDADGSAKLTDFGLAKGANFSNLTRPGAIVGSVDYMAPERIRGAPADSASDIYALGCVVFESLAGGPPFRGKSLFEVAGSILGDDPTDPCQQRDDAPPELSTAVLLALDKNPRHRPPTATAFANLLTVATRSA